MKRATIADAPAVLNTNDKAMWVLGYNAALDAALAQLSKEDLELLTSVEATLRREWNGLYVHKFQTLVEKLRRTSGVDSVDGGKTK